MPSTAGRRGDVAADLDDAIECGPVNHQVLDDRKRRRTPRLDDDLIATAEGAHVQLARRSALLRSVGLTVDHQRAGAADALAAVVIEHDGFLAFFDQALVQDVEQFEEIIAENMRLVNENPQQAALLIRYWLNDGKI